MSIQSGALVHAPGTGYRSVFALMAATLLFLLAGVPARADSLRHPSRDETLGKVSPERQREIQSCLEGFVRKQSLPYVRIKPWEPRNAYWGGLASNVPDNLKDGFPTAAGLTLKVQVGTIGLPSNDSFRRHKEREPWEGRGDSQVNKNPAYTLKGSIAGTISDEFGPAGRTIRIDYGGEAHPCIVMWRKGNWEGSVTVQRSLSPELYLKSNPALATERKALLERNLAEAIKYAEAFDDLLGGPNDTEPVTIEVLDANPIFTNSARLEDLLANTSPSDRERPVAPNSRQVELPLSAAPTAQTDAILAALSTTRTGAAADGVSLLLIRSRVGGAGTVTFSLEGAGEVGSLHPLNGNPFGLGALPVSLSTTSRPAPSSGGVAVHYAFALYRPPSLSWGGGVKGREVKVKTHFKPASTGAASARAPAEQKGEKSITLVRPPVVLVHGTYDFPVNCWATPLKLPNGSKLPTMIERLGQEGLVVTQVDWRSTNGSANPSDFVTNERTVYKNSGGIADAIEALRRGGFASTQADLVCHSQGGVIARVYAKGIRSSAPRDLRDPHFTAPEKCNDCWYHNGPNPTFHRGGIRRLITISSTHKGSDICRLLNAYQHAARPTAVIGGKLSPAAAVVTSLFLLGADYQQGVFTGGYRDQTPSSSALRAIGATPIPAHAIACVNDDEDMMTVLADDTYVSPEERAKNPTKYDKGYYQQRLELIWNYSNPDVVRGGFEFMTQSKDGELLAARKNEETRLSQEMAKLSLRASDLRMPVDEAAYSALFNKRNDHIRESTWKLRAAAFGNDRNDCTVAESSSHGGLTGAHRSTIEKALHGYAPRYPAMQSLVLDLLTDGRGRFSPTGFPNAYPNSPTPVRNPPSTTVRPGLPTITKPTRTVPRVGDKPLFARITTPAKPAKIGSVDRTAADRQKQKSTSGSEQTGNRPTVTGNKPVVVNAVQPVPVIAMGLSLIPAEDAVTVESVTPGGPADAAGLKAGDRLLALAGKRLRGLSSQQITALFASPTSAADITVERGEELLNLKLPGGKMPLIEKPKVTIDGPPIERIAGNLALNGFSPKQWDFRTSGKADLIMDDKDVLLRVPDNAPGGVEGWSKSALAGDFALDLGSRLSTWEPDPEDAIVLEYRLAAEPGKAAAVIIRRKITGAGESFEVVNGGETRVATVRGRHVNLTLRRKGDEFALLHFEPRNGGWVPVARFKQALGEEVHVGVSIAKTGASPLDLYVFLRPGSPIADAE